MPAEDFPGYQAAMDALFGEGSCRRIRIRAGGVGLLDDTDA